MRNDSLQSRGGDGRTFTMEDHPELIADVIRILNDIPASDVAKIALNKEDPLFPALAYLVSHLLITTKQYNILALELMNAGQKNPLEKSGILRTITDRMTIDRRRIYNAFGWNKYPTDEDPTCDVSC